MNEIVIAHENQPITATNTFLNFYFVNNVIIKEIVKILV